MPSKNSINRPKDKQYRNAHASALGKRRSKRVAIATRSSTGRYNKSITTPSPSESTSLALYKGNTTPNGVITNNTLSNKRAKKIKRNQKYIQNNNKKEDEAMEIETEEEKSSRVEQVKKALWTIVSEKTEGVVSVEAQGTTLGVQAF